VNFNEEVDWPSIFRGFIKRDSLADPRNRRRKTFTSTMLFVEAGFRELDDQVTGRSPVRKDGLAWARITREIIVRRARRLLAELPPEARRGVRIGEGGFKDRWPGLGGMSDFFMCMVRYACTDPRWRRMLDSGPKRALEALPAVRRGELSLAELITRIATQDLKLWVRLARCWLFPLLLTMDKNWKSVGHAAYGELLDSYAQRWVPVYENGLSQFRVTLRSDFDAVELSHTVSAHITGFAIRIAGRGRDDDLETERFARSVQALLYAAIDPGDGHNVARALDRRID
jgi:hypothetical protein